MEENTELVEKIEEGAVKELLNENEVVQQSNALPIIIFGVATLGVGFLIYKGIKYLRNKKKVIDITPDKVQQFDNISNSDEETEE